jgi:hypothetical protein
MRANPKFDAAAAITELGVGEALVSFLDEKGRPTIVERGFIFPPASRLGPLTPEERQAFIQASPMLAAYGTTVDRESAYELLRGKPATSHPPPAPFPPPPAGGNGPNVNDWGNHNGQQAQPRPTPTPQPRQSAPAAEESGGGFFGSLGEMFGGSTGPRGGKREGIIEAAAKSATRGMAGTVGREVGKQILRGVLGSILGGSSRRR